MGVLGGGEARVIMRQLTSEKAKCCVKWPRKRVGRAEVGEINVDLEVKY